MTPLSNEIVISGLGVTSAIGQGQSEFIDALLSSAHRFGVMQRSGRQVPGGNSHFLGAEIEELRMPADLTRNNLHLASLSSQVAAVTLHEAWQDASLDEVNPTRIGLIVGGSNFQQRELTQIHDRYRDREHFLRPTYALMFMDSDVCGICTELFGIRGFAHSLGGASASGQVSVLQAVQTVLTGQVDVCLALGALMDLSYWECQGFRSLGAMGSDCFAERPDLASRPYDKNRDGFIFGESCGAVVVERASTAIARKLNPYARVLGLATYMDGNRNPNPSLEGERKVIDDVLAQARLSARDIHYINPHATGSHIGDETELQAIRDSKLEHAYINTTKSITGHGLSAAGVIEIIATLLQMKAGALHPCRNLDDPIYPECNWVRGEVVHQDILRAITLSMGFGGANSALCIEKY